jgi:hypothetical protein
MKQTNKHIIVKIETRIVLKYYSLRCDRSIYIIIRIYASGKNKIADHSGSPGL